MEYHKENRTHFSYSFFLFLKENLNFVKKIQQHYMGKILELVVEKCCATGTGGYAERRDQDKTFIQFKY